MLACRTMDSRFADGCSAPSPDEEAEDGEEDDLEEYDWEQDDGEEDEDDEEEDSSQESKPPRARAGRLGMAAPPAAKRATGPHRIPTKSSHDACSSDDPSRRRSEPSPAFLVQNATGETIGTPFVRFDEARRALEADPEGRCVICSRCSVVMARMDRAACAARYGRTTFMTPPWRSDDEECDDGA